MKSITWKYSIGDTVYILDDLKIWEMSVTEVRISVQKYCAEQKIEYGLVSPMFADMIFPSSTKYYREHEVFASKEAICDYLLNN